MKMYLFYCANKIDGDEVVQRCRAGQGEQIKAIALPCTGKINLLYLLKAFETGADGVLVLACPEGKCRNLQGNLRAHNRVEAVDALLEEVGMGRGRMELVHLKEEDEGMEHAVGALETFRNKIRSLPALNVVNASESGRDDQRGNSPSSLDRNNMETTLS
ncbi:MAG: hydrogenase iron-sulfur subunit [Sedimentisphaerales bacterium]|nr:hydrogenase iron-sulfur subunit [Sedimentisphaerales bacterium]